MMRKIHWILREQDGVPGGNPMDADVVSTSVSPDMQPAVDASAAGNDDQSQPDDQQKQVPIQSYHAEKNKRQSAEDELRQMREEAAFLRGQLTAQTASAPVRQEQPQVPTPPVPPVRPRIDQFPDDYEGFERAMEEYEVKRDHYNRDLTKFELTQEFEQRMTAARQQQTREQAAATWTERLNKEAEIDPEIAAIASSWNQPGPHFMPLSGAMQEAILESDVGPKILRYLANNKAEATRIAAMSPTAAMIRIGEIHSAIKNKPAPEPPKRISQAPEPPTSVQTGGSAVVDLSNESTEDYITRRNQEEFGRAYK